MRSDFDPTEKKLAVLLEDWLRMQQKLYGSQRMWGVEGDAKAADIFAWMLANGQYLDRDIERTHELKEVSYYEPQMKECYTNALMMVTEGMSYWEGWMVGEEIPIPIEHAWNILDDKVIDFTSTLWGRDDEKRIYFGVEIPYDFVLRRVMETSVSGPYLYPYIMTQLDESSNSRSAESNVVSMAESRFDKLQDEVAHQYEKKGYTKEEAMKIGGAVAYDAGVKKYGKKGMEELARAGRNRAKYRRSRKNAEGFATESSNSMLNNSTLSDTMSNGLSNYEPIDSIIQEAPLGHGVAQDFGAEKRQGYNDKMDESLGMRHRGRHSQSMKDRRDEASAMDKKHSKMGRKYDDVMTMDAQGYDDKMDESLGMRHRGRHSQSMKDRRDEASAMDKRHSRKHRKYDDVGTMDMDAHGHEEFEAQYRIRDKNGDYWYKNSKTGANIKKLNPNRVLGNDRVRKAKRIPKTKANRRNYGHVGDFGLKQNMAETFHATNPVSGATDMVAFTESPADLVMPEGDGNVIGQSTPTTDFTPLGARAEGDFGTGFQYGAGATVGVVSAVIVTGFALQALQGLFGMGNN